MDEIELFRQVRPDVPSYPAAAGVVVVVRDAGAPDTGGRTRVPAGTPVTAVQVLYRAAESVEARPAPTLRADRWAYVKQLQHGFEVRRGTTGADRTKTMETWTRLDDRQIAARLESGRISVSGIDPIRNQNSPQEDYASLRSLPTDPRALLARICTEEHIVRERSDCAFSAIARLLHNVAVPPRLQATLYRALATIPGVVVERNVTDLAGRPTIAVGHARDGQRHDILLDPRTFEYRGDRSVLTRDFPAPSRTARTARRPGRVAFPFGGRAGTELTASARLAAGIVDRPGQLP